MANARDRLVVLGDFNAPHTGWGYPKDSRKGQNLLDATENNSLWLATLLDKPTRTGNSVTRDTSPDLTFTNYLDQITWTNFDENLGSDHNIIGLSLNSPRIRQKLGTATITDWTAFREKLGHPDRITNAADWANFIRSSHEKTTRKLATTTDVPAIDPHLLRMWEARRSLAKRWKKQRHNRKLKIRIAELTQKANDYAQTLEKNNWL